MSNQSLRAAAISCTLAGAAFHAGATTITLDNSPGVGESGCYFGDCAHYAGEVFTAPVTGYVTSVTLWTTHDAEGTIGGGLGTWRKKDLPADTIYTSPITLYTGPLSPAVAGPHTFMPNAQVKAGKQYVAYLTGNVVRDTPLATSGVPTVGLDGQAEAQTGNPYWYHVDPKFPGSPDFQIAITFVSAPIPEPASWTFMLAGLGLTGVALRGRRAPRFPLHSGRDGAALQR